jgi:putative peptidoglycan lipid II flippase
MLLRAGLISLLLLLASRVLGLLRETAQASAFGATAAGDVAVLMFTLPDLVAGIFVTGALSYVLLPAWANLGVAQVQAQQQRLGRWLLALGALMVVLVAATGPWLAHRLAAGAVSALGESAVARALLLGSLSAPLALLAALWITRLQHAQDALGMYAANLVVNIVLIGAIFFVAAYAVITPANGQFDSKTWLFLGLGLLLAGLLRLAWLHWRMRVSAQAQQQFQAHVTPIALSAVALALPKPSVWLWAALSAGLPLALLLIARSNASGEGEGALAIFNYAWKLIELPLILAVQLVATLAFAHVAQSQGAARQLAVRRALVLAWALACAACAAVAGFAPALAQLLFGYGRMDANGLAQVALWAQAGAWSLLPQAVIAVLLTLLASVQGLRPVALMYACACLGLVAAASVFAPNGRLVMMQVTGTLTVLALGIWLLARHAWQGAWPWRDTLAPLAACVALAGAAQMGLPNLGRITGTLLAGLAALLVLAAAWAASPTLRAMLGKTK